MKSPLTPSLSPAFAEAASRRQASGGEGRVRGILSQKINASLLVFGWSDQGWGETHVGSF